MSASSTPTADTPPRVMTESELARVANRSQSYVRVARTLKLIEPIGRTSAGTLIYHPSAVERLAEIRGPILTSANAPALARLNPELAATPVMISQRAFDVWDQFRAALPE